jgi:hypothetical protein
VNRIKRAAEALGVRRPKNVRENLAKLTAALLATIGLFNAGFVNAAALTAAKVSISDPRPSQTNVSYTFQGSSVSLAAIQCIKVQFATTATGSTVPGSMNTSSSASINGTNTDYIPTPASWTLDKTTNGLLKYTYATGETPASASNRVFQIDGVTNGNLADTAYYMRFNTYSDATCATPVDNTTVEFIYTNGQTLSLTVDGSLTFTVNAITTGAGLCAGGATADVATTSTTIPFGTVTSGSPKMGCQDLIASTNSTNGYTIYIKYDNAPKNALNDLITDVSGTNNAPAAFPTGGSVPAQGAYGYTTNDTTLTGGGTTNAGEQNRFNTASLYAAVTTTNAEVGYESAGVSSTHYLVNHKVAVSATTKPGTYSNTIMYTCTPVY